MMCYDKMINGNRVLLLTLICFFLGQGAVRAQPCPPVILPGSVSSSTDSSSSLVAQPLTNLFSDLDMNLSVNLVDAQLSEASVLSTTSGNTNIQDASSTLQAALADGRKAVLKFQPGTSEIHLGGGRLLILEVHDCVVNFNVVEKEEITITGEVSLECVNLFEYTYQGFALRLLDGGTNSQAIQLEGSIYAGLVDGSNDDAILAMGYADGVAQIVKFFDFGQITDGTGTLGIHASVCAKRCVCVGSTTGRCRPNDCNPDDPKNCPSDSGHTCQERNPL